MAVATCVSALSILITVVSEVTVDRVGDDFDTLNTVLKESAARYSGEIYQAEQDLVAWFREQDTKVNEVDRKPFKGAVTPLLTGDDVPYTWDHFNRLGAIK